MRNQAILCVDDETIILLSLIQELKKAFGDKFLYEKALNSNEALITIDELIDEGVKVILIISDWLMPGIKGDEFIKLVHERYPEIKAVMITGNADSTMIDYLRSLDSILGVLKKPWDHEELLSLIRAAVD